MLKRSLLILAVFLLPATAVWGDETAMEIWLSTSNTSPVGPEAPQLDLAVGGSADLYIWCRPKTGANLRNFSIHVVAEQSGLDLVDGSFEVIKAAGPGLNRFEFVTDSGYNPPLVSEFDAADVAAGNVDSVLNLQGFTIFPAANIVGMGPVCGTGETGCAVALDGEPAWLLGSLSVDAVTSGAAVDLHLQVGDFGMNQVLYPLGDYNFSGVIDIADRTVWQAAFGSLTNLAADGNRNGIVDAADYTVWRDNLGEMSTLQPTSEVLVLFGSDTTPMTPQPAYNAFIDRGVTLAGDDADAVIHIGGPGAGGGGPAIPEPPSVAIAILAVAFWWRCRPLEG